MTQSDLDTVRRIVLSGLGKHKSRVFLFGLCNVTSWGCSKQNQLLHFPSLRAGSIASSSDSFVVKQPCTSVRELALERFSLATQSSQPGLVHP